MKRVMMAMAMALMAAMHVSAQGAQVEDKDLVGTWIMESMQWDGEKKTECGKATGYTQLKFYGPDGEYACSELALTNDGKVVVMPHEYGTYTFSNGVYTEMGRKVAPDGLVMTSKTTFKGRWNTRNDIWRKVVLPDKVVKYIVDCCKSKSAPADIQQLIRQTVFK